MDRVNPPFKIVHIFFDLDLQLECTERESNHNRSNIIDDQNVEIYAFARIDARICGHVAQTGLAIVRKKFFFFKGEGVVHGHMVVDGCFLPVQSYRN